MKTKFQSPHFDEAVAFIVFILCIILSFFNQPVIENAVTLVN